LISDTELDRRRLKFLSVKFRSDVGDIDDVKLVNAFNDANVFVMTRLLAGMDSYRRNAWMNLRAERRFKKPDFFLSPNSLTRLQV
jgi:hypothetical protein